MSDVNVSAPGGSDGEAITVVTPATDTGEALSVSQAARALAAARHKPKQPEQAAAPSEPEVETPDEPAQADDAQPETADPVETTDEADPAEVPPIEPPRSWTKEAKDRWSSLPRETQEYLSVRETERDREVRRSQNETAEKLKGLTVKEQQVELARQQYESALPALLQTLQQQMAGEFADIRTQDDVNKLAAEDWPRFARWQAHKMQVDSLQAEAKSNQERQSHEFRNKWAEFASKEDAALLERAPELADKARSQKIADGAVAVLKDIGFDDKELAAAWNGENSVSLRDHRIQLLILDAMKYREAKVAKPVAKPVPTVQRPGVSKSQGAGNSEVIQALTDQLSRTGSLRAAQELRAAQLKSQRRA